MGPSGVHSLLVELHTRHFDEMCLSYLETALEQELIYRDENATKEKSSLAQAFVPNLPTLEALGSFANPERYSGFVPSKTYLTDMYNRLVDADTASADQHTSLVETDQITLDDSHKVYFYFNPLYNGN
jgi:hypothetical protein